MAGEHHPHPKAARSGQSDATALDNAVSANDLAANTNLHVIDEEGSRLAVAQICELDGDRQIVCVLHGSALRGTMEPAPRIVRSDGSPTSTVESNRHSSGSGEPSAINCQSMSLALVR